MKKLFSFLFALSFITFGCSKEEKELLHDLSDTSPVKTEELGTFSIPAEYYEMGEEFGRMIDYSLKWASSNDVFDLEDTEEIIDLFDKGILSFYEETYGYGLSELGELKESLQLNRQILKETELSGLKDELSEKQFMLLNEIIDIADNYGRYGFKNQIEERVISRIEDLPEQEREFVYQSIAFIVGGLEVINIAFEIDPKWSWGTFFCNAASGGVGVIYGAAVGAFCPPCGVAVGIAVGSALSTAVCS